MARYGQSCVFMESSTRQRKGVPGFKVARDLATGQPHFALRHHRIGVKWVGVCFDHGVRCPLAHEGFIEASGAGIGFEYVEIVGVHWHTLEDWSYRNLQFP